MFGGGARADAQSQIIIRSLAVIMGAVALIRFWPINLAPIRFPLLFLGACLLLMAIQLVPLPPALWLILPGRELFGQIAPLTGIEQPWRPISLTPDATLNSALATLPAFAALLCFSAVSRAHYFRVLVALVALILLSGVLGLLQVSTLSSSLYFYDVTNANSAVGVFANRNHQAAFLAMLLPILAAVAAYPNSDISVRFRTAMAIFSGLFILPLILVTGSRTGLVLMAVGVVVGIALWRSMPKSGSERVKGKSKRLPRLPFDIPYKGWILVVLGAVVVTLPILFSRAVSVQRLFAKDIEADYRIRLFWPMVDIFREFFPFGSGFGSFADIFRIFEPSSNLALQYFNHAHNDALEILIEGGVFSLAAAIIFIVWWVLSARLLWATERKAPQALVGRLGCSMTLMLLLASLSDYPVRTPLGAVMFVLGCSFMCVGKNGIKATHRKDIEVVH